MPQAVRLDTLRRAARLVGGVDALARALKASTWKLEAWLNGHEPVPDEVFLRAVDLIEDRKAGGDDTQHGSV
jgi:hypothetical protein